MQRSTWARWTHDEIAATRAGGRRRYNARRAAKADRRRFWVFHMFGNLPSDFPWWRYGVQATIAKIFGVSRSTICRDFAEFRRPVLRIFRSAPFRKLFRHTLTPKERAALTGEEKPCPKP